MYRLALRGVIRIADNLHIQPIKSDPAWIEYKAWTRAGNVAAAAAPELEPLADILLRINSRIDQDRARRHELPILFGGVPFDSDKEARENISGTLLRLLRGDGLPADWVGWRDNHNEMHWAASSPGEVLEHLRGLSSAIEDRKQALLIAAWMKKAATQALVDIGDRAGLEAFDVDAGWP